MILEQIKLDEVKSSFNWELYSSEKGAGIAAYNLTKKFVGLINKAVKAHNEKHICREHLAKEIHKKMEATMEKYSSLGATDTEPFCELAHQLCKYLKVELGRWDY